MKKIILLTLLLCGTAAMAQKQKQQKSAKQPIAQQTQKQTKQPITQQTQDQTFPSADFKPATAKIEGVVGGADRYVAVHMTDLLAGKPVRYSTTADAEGRFELTIPLVGAQEALLENGDGVQQIVLSPGDELTVDFGDKAVFEGRGARLNNEIAQFPRVGMADAHETTPDAMAYLELRKRLYDAQLKNLDTYIKEHPGLSEQFKFYELSRVKYETANDLMQHQYHAPLPEEYVRYVRENFPLDDPRVYTLVDVFGWYLRDYVRYFSARNSDPSFVDWIELVGQDPNLSDASRQLLVEMRALEEASQKESDPKKKSAVFETPEAEDVLTRLSADTKLTEALANAMEDMELDRGMKGVETVLDTPLLRDFAMAPLYLERLDRERNPLPRPLLAALPEHIANPHIRARIAAVSDHYADLQTKPIAHAESLRDVSGLSLPDDGAAIFAQLTEEFRGKVLYIDFWGTWCGPCRENMKLMPPIKEQFAGKDVMFVYFANRSPEPAWRSMIAELGLTGANAAHFLLPVAQQSLLEEYFAVKAFPTYIIVGRDGKILDRHPPRPDDGRDKVATAIDKALSL